MYLTVEKLQNERTEAYKHSKKGERGRKRDRGWLPGQAAANETHLASVLQLHLSQPTLPCMYHKMLLYKPPISPLCNRIRSSTKRESRMPQALYTCFKTSLYPLHFLRPQADPGGAEVNYKQTILRSRKAPSCLNKRSDLPAKQRPAGTPVYNSIVT